VEPGVIFRWLAPRTGLGTAARDWTGWPVADPVRRSGRWARS